MKTTNEYLDHVKQKLGLETDYKLAKWLGTTTGVVSNFRLKKRVIDDYTAARIADALEINPMEVIAAANAERAEREKDEKRREYWRKVFAGCAAACLLIMAVGIENQKVMAAETENSIDLPAI